MLCNNVGVEQVYSVELVSLWKLTAALFKRARNPGMCY